MGEGATFLKAEADGASLIGVPYVGVLLCEWVGGTSSMTIEVGEPTDSDKAELAKRDCPVDWASKSFARAWSLLRNAKISNNNIKDELVYKPPILPPPCNSLQGSHRFS